MGGAMDDDQEPPRRVGRRDVLQRGVGAAAGALLSTGTAWAAPGSGSRSRRAEAMSNAVASDGVPRVGAGRVVWSVPTTLPMIALTFDDGPDPHFTPRILDVLE